MDYAAAIISIAVGLAAIYIFLNLKRVTVYEFECGLRYRQGRYEKELAPGVHWIYRPVHTVHKMDIRTRSITLPGQEVLSADNVGLKLSLAVKFKVDDPYKALIEVEDYFQALYLDIQVSLRDIVGEVPIDDFLSKRQEIGEELLARTKDKVAAYGILLESAALKDIMFPGELKNIFAQVVNARKEGQAALERARGESAALRNLANTANLLEKNPGLLQLRIIQAIDHNPGSTIILGDIAETGLPTQSLPGKKSKGKLKT